MWSSLIENPPESDTSLTLSSSKARYGDLLTSFLGLSNGRLTVCVLTAAPKGYKASEQNALGNLLLRHDLWAPRPATMHLLPRRMTITPHFQLPIEFRLGLNNTHYILMLDLNFKR
uniref:Uncharacterized protein n=1 Tax=Cucumis melo TaxID=3656 RepID=A0A9I9E8F8_CUCME